MCEYLAPESQGACDRYEEEGVEKVHDWQTSFSTAEIKTVEIDGKRVIARWTNGQRVGSGKQPSGTWLISNLGGPR